MINVPIAVDDLSDLISQAHQLDIERNACTCGHVHLDRRSSSVAHQAHLRAAMRDLIVKDGT